MPSRAPSQRQLRVGEELRHAVVGILSHAHFHDPDLATATITVTEVRVSPDLRNATAFVIPLGGRDTDRVVAALNRAVGYVRREVGREVALKFVPRITFAADTSFAYSSHIETLLQRPEVERDLKPEPGVPGGGEKDHGP